LGTLIALLLWCGAADFDKSRMIHYFAMSALGVTFLQTAWLLPALCKRAQAIIDGQNPKSSQLHIVYVLIELVKVVSLMYIGARCL